MTLLQTLGTGQGYLNVGILGFPKSGKTYTATKLASGTRAYLGLDGPIVMFDTEGGSEYVAQMVLRETGKPLIGVRSRSFDDLMRAAQEALDIGASVFIADSMTHVWRELCDAYLKGINDVRRAQNKPPRTRLEFQDWGPIKAKWAKWTDFYLNAPMHKIICGRAGYDYDYEDREDGSGKDLVKTGVKMKTEGEFGFEPSLLVEMERVQVMTDQTRILHRATVIGDRFNVIDAQWADNPTFEFFRPHIDCLVPGAHAPIDTETKSDLGVNEDGDSHFYRERKARTIICEEIQGELLRKWPGQTGPEKSAKIEALEAAFGTRSWTAVESMDSTKLRAGLAALRQVTQGTDTTEGESNATDARTA